MPVKPGFSCYACDRAPVAHKSGRAPEVYLQEGESVAREWMVDYAWTDQFGAPQTMTLCPECAAKLRLIATAQAEEMSRFANEGKR